MIKTAFDQIYVAKLLKLILYRSYKIDKFTDSKYFKKQKIKYFQIILLTNINYQNVCHSQHMSNFAPKIFYKQSLKTIKYFYTMRSN